MINIAQLGQPVLRQVAQPLTDAELAAPELQQLIDSMLEKVAEVRGAGLAAPQVFVSRRLFVAAIKMPEGEDELPLYEALINPRIVQVSAEQGLAWEGCLSFEELLVLVPRHQALRVEYLDRRGHARALELEGFPARVIQHENDHLDGIVTIDRATSTKHIIKASELDAARAALRQGKE